MDENLCPNCRQLTRICGKEEIIEIDPNDMTKATLKTILKRACINPLCTLFTGDLSSPTVQITLNYERDGKIVTETESRPNVDLGAVTKIARQTEYRKQLPAEVV